MKYLYNSQFRQDEFFNEIIFKNKKDGFFVDIGAHDGQTISNSLFFERNRNWNGICIEPNPNVFEKLQLHRTSTNLNVCIGESNKTVKFTQIEGYSEMLSGISDKYDERHMQRIAADMKNKGGKLNEIDTQMITLDSIEALRNQAIDFISIDTEGNEFDIVSSLNFSKLDIKAFVIENNYGDKRIENHLSNFEYIPIIKLDVDEVYLNKKYVTIGIKFRVKVWKLKNLMNRIGVKLNIN